MIFVFTGNYHEFRRFCQELEMSERQALRQGIRYISDEHTLCGQDMISVIAYGHYYAHPRASKINNEISYLRCAGRLR